MPVEFPPDEEAARCGRYGERLSQGTGGAPGLIAPATAGGEPAAVALVRHAPGDPGLGEARGGFWDFLDGGVLLLQLQQAGKSIGAAERQLAARIIEDSDNAAASALWRAVRAGPGLEAGNAVLGLTQTVPGPGGYWGLTTTTVTDQLRLLAVLTSARSPLSATARGYELRLMRDVDAGQDWGVTKAASTGTRPAVKNGWLPVGPRGLWVINSIGAISHAGHQLTIAVLSAGNPSQSDGISLVQAAATTVVCAVATAGQSSPDGSHRVGDTCAPARNALRVEPQ